MHVVITGITSVLMAALIPLCLLQPPQEAPMRQSLLIIRQELPAQTVRFQTEQGILEQDMEQYLAGVVMAEMPLSFPIEALKAQATAARTYTCRRLEQPKHDGFDLCTDPSCCQSWMSRDQMEAKLGDGALCKKAEQAVQETAGQVLVYEGALIDAVYFSCSGGYTESAAAVWGSDIPYLQSVESAGEKTAKHFASEVRVPAERFREIILSADPSAVLEEQPIFWIGETDRTSSGAVASMIIGGRSFAGTELRRLFGLRSTLFDLTVTDTEMVFSVRGNGHRVGMSQYGAAAMAEQGSSYDEILRYYYQGAELQKASRLLP